MLLVLMADVPIMVKIIKKKRAAIVARPSWLLPGKHLRFIVMSFLKFTWISTHMLAVFT
jgi:hypothetical protein